MEGGRDTTTSHQEEETNTGLNKAAEDVTMQQDGGEKTDAHQKKQAKDGVDQSEEEQKRAAPNDVGISVERFDKYVDVWEEQLLATLFKRGNVTYTTQEEYIKAGDRLLTITEDEIQKCIRNVQASIA